MGYVPLMATCGFSDPQIKTAFSDKKKTPWISDPDRTTVSGP